MFLIVFRIAITSAIMVCASSEPFMLLMRPAPVAVHLHQHHASLLRGRKYGILFVTELFGLSFNRLAIGTQLGEERFDIGIRRLVFDLVL